MNKRRAFGQNKFDDSSDDDGFDPSMMRPDVNQAAVEQEME